jgi:aminopeptidase N
MRWTLLSNLVALGAVGPDAIEAEFDRDRTASGERAAGIARALVPTAESKAETWRQLTAAETPANWLQRSLLSGFHHPAQLELTAPYVSEFFEVADRIWDTRDSEPAQEFMVLAYPGLHIAQSTVDMSDNWLANPHHAAGLRRYIGEGRDGVVRSLKARVKDAE